MKTTVMERLARQREKHEALMERLSGVHSPRRKPVQKEWQRLASRLMEQLSVTHGQLIQKNRTRDIRLKRILITAALRHEWPSLPLQELGGWLSRDHTTLVSSLRRAAELLSLPDPLILPYYQSIHELLNHPLLNDETALRPPDA